ncbi:MAG: endoglucanase, partial [Streptococcus sp.]
IIFASEREKSYLKLVQQNKYIFTQDLPLNNYYDATMTTMIALELF